MSIRRTCWDDHFLCVHTRRNDGKCWMLMQFDPEFVHSVLLSFALPVRNVWLIKIFQFPFSQILFLLLLRCCCCRLLAFLSLRNWQKCISFLLLGFISRTCYCPLSNKYISCYLFINMDGVFRQTNSWYVVIYRVLSAVCLFFCGPFSFRCRWGNHFWTFIRFKSGQKRYIRWNILQQIKSI